MSEDPSVDLPRCFHIFQAWCLDPILLNKTKLWAAISRGYFPVLNEYGFAQFDPGLEQQFRWAGIKSVDRAIEKAVRLYSQVR